MQWQMCLLSQSCSILLLLGKKHDSVAANLQCTSRVDKKLSIRQVTLQPSLAIGLVSMEIGCRGLNEERTFLLGEKTRLLLWLLTMWNINKAGDCKAAAQAWPLHNVKTLSFKEVKKSRRQMVAQLFRDTMLMSVWKEQKCYKFRERKSTNTWLLTHECVRT